MRHSLYLLAIALLCLQSAVTVFAQEEDNQEQNPLVELEAMISGPWALINDGRGGRPDGNPFDLASRACIATPTLPRVQFDNGANRQVPTAPYLSGNIVYYVADSRLHRLDLTLRRVTPITGVQKGTNPQGRAFWRLSSGKRSIRIAFGRARSRNAVLPILVEERAIYARCPILRTGPIELQQVEGE